MTHQPPDENHWYFSYAIFSKDRIYRYDLRRNLGYVKSTCLFIMLNPSTADEYRNDPTVTRCINFAKYWGFGRLEVCNIFAYRATDPKELYNLSPEAAIGPENNVRITKAVIRADRVVCAWGNHGELYGRGDEVILEIRDLDTYPLAFKITQKGQPIHPLYQKADAELITWTG